MYTKFVVASISFGILVTIAGCGGGGGGGKTPSKNFSPPAVQDVKINYDTVKALRFTWQGSEGAKVYKLLENIDGGSGFEIVAETSSSKSELLYEIPLYNKLNAQYKVAACNDSGCNNSATLFTSTLELAQLADYIKGENTEEDDSFGTDLSLSQDGSTLAVSAHWEHSDSRAINAGQDINQPSRYGAVYVFNKTQAGWIQTSYIKPDNLDSEDSFGASLSLSADGKRLAVGAKRESSSSANPEERFTNNGTHRAGAVYIFELIGISWQQTAYLKADNPSTEDLFGETVWLSSDGRTLAVGALKEDSPAITINDQNRGDGDPELSTGPNNPRNENYGAVYIYRETGGTWKQEAYIKPPEKVLYGHFGSSLDLSKNGNTLVVGSGDNLTNSPPSDGGRLYIYTRKSNEWQFEHSFFPDHLGQSDNTNNRVAINDHGNLVASKYQVDTNQAVLFILSKEGDNWKEIRLDTLEIIGDSKALPNEIELNSEGDQLAVGISGDNNCGSGFITNGLQPGSCQDSGAVIIYEYKSNQWAQTAYIKSLDTGVGDEFGRRLSLSGDGSTLAVGSIWEDNKSASHQLVKDDSTSEAGAVYVF